MEETTSRRGLLVGLALGVPIIVYGIRGALVDAADTKPAELATWVTALAVADDLLVIPAALAIAWLAHRVVPAPMWPAARAGLITIAVLTAIAWPLIRGYGHDPHNPSLFPRNYTTGLLAALTLTALTTATWAFLAHRRTPSRKP